MRFGRGAIATALVTLGCTPAVVRAQPLVGVTVGVLAQGAGDSDVPYWGPPFGGTSLAALVMLDVPIGTG
jgi:hypothetical protein